ncbi:MAG: HD-GYP domain-containing protein [Candidatus Aminicenantaceae bacterium]
MERIANIEEFERMENLFYSHFVPQEEEGDCFSFDIIKREDNRDSGFLSPSSGLKIASAKKVLRNLNENHTRLFMNNGYSSLEDSPERQRFFNSNILHFIAITDKYEDSLYHSQLVSNYTLLLTQYLGIEDREFLTDIERGALLHDIGKIGIPQSILRKPGSLTYEEKETIKYHPLFGYEMIKEFDFLTKEAQVVLYHHEQYDGSGYPYSLIGKEIPLEARIFAIADTLDAITSDRPYREGTSFEDAREEIERNSGTQFDPLLVDIFLSIPLEKLQQIKESHETYSSTLIH